MEQKFLDAYTDHADALFRYCLFKVSDREVAKDLVQDAFTKTWVYLKDGNIVTNLRPFLYRILTNSIIDYYRKSKATSLDAMAEEGFDKAYEDQIDMIDQIDGAQAIALLSKLPKDYKDVLFMRYVEDLDVSEIAEITGENPNTISVRISRGIKKLQELIPNK